MVHTSTERHWLAGVDGCPGGWIVVFVQPDMTGAPPRIVSSFAEIAFAPEQPRIITVDVPIGLPARSPAKGRLAESEVRALLGERKSSVFRVPSRRAVEASVLIEPVDERERFLAACKIARETSEDGKAFAKQGFNILPKVAEVDRFLREHRDWIGRVYETHPELAFWQLNDEEPLVLAKKIKSRVSASGLDLRRDLLAKFGFAKQLISQPAPKGAGDDDLIDALACAATALRIEKGLAQSFPRSPPRDEFGLPMAIWA